MREKDVEDYLKGQALVRGGVALKFVSPGCSGVPDRIVILPGGKVGFLELKAPGEKPRTEQRVRLGMLQRLGCLADYADSKEQVDAFLIRLGAGGMP